MGCGMGMIKYLLFIFNFIFVLCGLAILILGVIVQLQYVKYASGKIEEIDLNVPSITLIVVGSIIFIIAFFGCCGAIRESHCMVVTFASLLLTILIVQVAIAIYTFVEMKNSEELNVEATYRKEVFDRYTRSNEDKELVDMIQNQLECCGVLSSNDFKDIGVEYVPGSCCNKDAKTARCFPDEVFKQGCAPAIQQFLKSGLAILGGIALGIAAIELIGIIFALCLANSIRNAERRGYSV
ncbi:CD63 antigen-like [Pseudomyrmex gracilis]|uniref:CD63 antigen-like n=1 Tax=Pseudomyrmex gracilis TaxID=219809 RepID=UPI0009958823|nr:CD63 antigen-like [Pseudomyrmex gracilis]